MRIAVERLQPVQAAEHEADDRLAGEVSLGLAPRLELAEPRAGRELGGEDPAGRQLVDHVGHVDERVAAVVVGEHPLVGGLDAVVELLADALPDLLDERRDVEVLVEQAGGGHGRVEAVEVGADRLVDARVLHLDRDGPPVLRHGAVHLADRRRRDRHRVPLGEQLSRAAHRARRGRPRPPAPGSSAARRPAAARAPGAPARASRRRRSWRAGRASSGRPSCCRGWLAMSSAVRSSSSRVELLLALGRGEQPPGPVRRRRATDPRRRAAPSRRCGRTGSSSASGEVDGADDERRRATSHPIAPAARGPRSHHFAGVARTRRTIVKLCELHHKWQRGE